MRIIDILWCILLVLGHCRIVCGVCDKIVRYHDFECIERSEVNLFNQEMFHKKIDHRPLFRHPETLHFSLKTAKGHIIKALFIDNHADTLVVLGQGFPGDINSMRSYADLFGISYNYLCFEYRWNHVGRSLVSNPLALFKMFDYFFFDTTDEVESVISAVQQHKQHHRVVGYGVCFSAWIFSLAQHIVRQRDAKKLFDKIICDSAFHSFHDLAYTILHNPALPLDPQFGYLPGWIASVRSVLLPSCLIRPMAEFFSTLTGSLSMSDIVNQSLETPFLFIHGRSDCFAPYHLFMEKTWRGFHHNKIYAFITPYEHAYNDQKPELFVQVLRHFIDHDVGSVVKSLA